MGTRADFYVQVADGGLAWLGSVAFDGYVWSETSAPNNPLLHTATEQKFRDEVSTLGRTREDFTSPEEGWPWPWTTSNTTDFAYVRGPAGELWVYRFGSPQDAAPELDFPDMTKVQNVTFGKRSGVAVVGLREEPPKPE